MAVPAGVNLNVLGGFRLQVGGQDGPDLPRKTRALLAVLAVEDARPQSRETVAELLWPGRGPEQSRNSLKEALFRLREPLRAHDVVVTRDGGLALGPGVATDLAAFRRLAAAADLPALRRAADTYAGPLMAGFRTVEDDFNDWLALSRAALEKNALAVLARIADLCTASGDAAGAMAAAERMFAIDRLDEEIHWRLLDSCAAAGRRAEALRHYETIANLMRRELATIPGTRTREIVKRLHQEMTPLSGPQPAPRGAPPPIAVLPFLQLGDEAVPSHLADGILVDTVCQLAGLRELQVISHGSTLAYRDPRQDLRQVGQELGARYVVRGAMRRRGNALRLTTELADAGTGTVVWARTHDTTATLDFAAQDRLVAQIVNTLAPRVQEQELRRVRGKRPDSLSAYEKTLLAREQMLALDRGSFADARNLLDAAICEEPGYADAFALLGDWHSLFLSQGWAESRDLHVSAAERQTARALELDRDNPRALTLMGHRRAIYHRDYDAARAMFAHALSVAPGSAQAWLWSSFTYAFIGDAQEAMSRARHALDLSPRDREVHDFFSALCVAHYTAGDYATAVEWGQRCLMQPSHRRSIYGWTAASLAAMGRIAEAGEIARRGMAAEPTRRVGTIVRNHGYRDATRRNQYGAHLLAAGFPP